MHGKKYGFEKPFGDACDFVINVNNDNSKISILQLTDIQVIDASQCRGEKRLRDDEKKAWANEKIENNCYNHIRSLVTQTNPDLILITGDIVYGEFDDSGKVLSEFIDFMDSFKLPWAPIFGNHDNESLIGIDRQCEMYEHGAYCIFKRGTVTGNSNYTIGLVANEKLKTIIYMIDTHGCVKEKGIYLDQLLEMQSKAKRAATKCGEVPQGFMAMHIPVDIFRKAEYEKGYTTDETSLYILGVDKKAIDGDFGFSLENETIHSYIPTNEEFNKTLKVCNINGIFAGHFHNKSTCINYKGIKLVYGLKTGQYDYHVAGQVGGTLITLDKISNYFNVQHIPSLIPLCPVPSKSPSYKDFFAEC